MMFYLASLVSAMLVLGANAYPNGATSNTTQPMEAFAPYCSPGNFRPNHGDNMAQSGTSPFRITVVSPSRDQYSPGKPVSVTIEGINPRHKLKGFVIQGDNTEMSFGGQLQCTQGKEAMFCGKQIITHKESSLKRKIECTWTPPDYQVGSVRFVATVVKDFRTFWTGVTSEKVLRPDPTTMTYKEKTRQMREQMLRGVNMFRQMSAGDAGGNPLAALMKKMASGQAQQGQQNGNPMAAIMRNFGGGEQAQAQIPGNPWAGVQNQQTMGFDSKSLLSMFGGRGGSQNSDGGSQSQSAMLGGDHPFAGYGQYFQQ